MAVIGMEVPVPIVLLGLFGMVAAARRVMPAKVFGGMGLQVFRANVSLVPKAKPTTAHWADVKPSNAQIPTCILIPHPIRKGI